MKKTQVLKRIDKLLQAKYIGFNEKKLYKDRNYEQKFKFELTRIMDFMRNINRDSSILF